MIKEAMKLALEALEEAKIIGGQRKADNAITALREALAEQPAQQEPDYKALYEKAAQRYNELAALMEQPAQRTWVGLTDDDLKNCTVGGAADARKWEAKLKEKNT